MTNTTSYTLTKVKLQNLTTRNGGDILLCQYCRQPIEIGKDVVHKNNWGLRYYHVECFEKVQV